MKSSAKTLKRKWGIEMNKDFNAFRFAGLDFKEKSNKYWTMERVSADETKIVVKTSTEQIVKTRYGYALILDEKHVVFLKDWQVSDNYFGVEVLLTKEYFIPKKWGEFDEFEDNAENLEWTTWLEAAKDQSGVDEDGFKLNPVSWEK